MKYYGTVKTIQQNPRKLFAYGSKLGGCENTGKKKAKPLKKKKMKNDGKKVTKNVHFCLHIKF